MTGPPVDANQWSCQPGRVPATARLASERPVNGFVRTKRERTDGIASHCARCLRKPSLYSDEPLRAVWASTGSTSVGHEVIAAHGTTTAPAAIVAPIRIAGVARDSGDRGASVSRAGRTGILSRSRGLRAGSARRVTTAAAPAAPPAASVARNRRHRGADRGRRGHGLGLSRRRARADRPSRALAGRRGPGYRAGDADGRSTVGRAAERPGNRYPDCRTRADSYYRTGGRVDGERR